MVLLKVAPDTVWLPQEVRESFSVAADMPKELVPIAAFPHIKAAIAQYQRVHKWQFIEKVPRYRPPAHLACCALIARGLPGADIPLRFEVSPLQADPEDIATADMEAADDAKRLFVDNKIDWVAVLHFIRPAIHVNQNELIESLPGEMDGFRSPEAMPTSTWAQLIWGGKKS